MEKMPPFEKIYEAFGAIADGRVAMRENSASVHSSNREKVYTVLWEGDIYRSSDSATYWQGYPGYPVIVVLMLQGKLPYHVEVAKLFCGVNWAQLNKKHKRNYVAAAAEVLDSLAKRGADVSAITRAANDAYTALEQLDIELGRAKTKPEK